MTNNYESLLNNQEIFTQTEYHNMDSCNSCGHPSSNSVTVKDTISGHVCESETVCQVCGHKDYWAYGWFESGQDIESKCLKY